MKLLGAMILALIAVAILLQTGCASPEPSRREFRDGPMPTRAPVFVAPGYAPAGAGLPEYMPGQPTPSVKRGEDRRVLPPTKEIGIWNSGEHPIDFDPNAAPILLGHALPIPATVGTDADKVLPSACAQSMALIAEPGGRPYPLLRTWSEDAKKCMAARLYAKCAEDLLREYMGHKAEAQWMDLRYEVLLKATVKTAMEFKNTECGKATMPPDAEVFYNWITRQWDRGMAVKLFMAGVR